MCNSNNGGNNMSRTEGTTEYYCNWAVFSKAIHNILKEVPTLDAEGKMLTEKDYRWAHAVKRLINTVFEPSGGDRGYHLFDEQLANHSIKSELLRRSTKDKLTP